MIRMLFLFLVGGVVFPAFAQQAGESQAAASQPDKQYVPSRLTVENIKQETEALRNPAIEGDSAKKTALNDDPAAPAPVLSKSATPVTLDDNGKDINDPTQMTGSFSRALHRIKSGQGLAPPVPPNITLVAKAIYLQKNKSAMLKVGGQTRMVREGNRFSFVENKQFFEVMVNEIDQDHVVITLLPMGMQMILQ